MKLIIAGTRGLHLNSPLTVGDIMYSFNLWPSEIVSGGARGIDQYGEEYGHNRDLLVKVFEADWYGLGKSAGPTRNKQMAKYADKLLLIWDGESRGSANMKKEMLALNKPVYELILRKHNVT